MAINDWVSFAAQVISTVAVLITLIYELIKYVQKAIKEKNWNKLLDLVLGYMEAAEDKFTNGADKKQWVLAMVQASAHTINYDIDVQVISDLIDRFCAMSNIVNAPTDLHTEATEAVDGNKDGE